MNKATQERYERNADGIFCIDVPVDRAGDLYNNFNRNASFSTVISIRTLLDNLIDFAVELGSQPFLLRFSLAQPPVIETSNGCGVASPFFLYCVSRKQQLLRKLLYCSGIFLMLDIVIYCLSC